MKLMRSQVARRKLSATDTRNLRTLLLLNIFEGQKIGERIKQARNEKGLRQEDLADLINVSTRTIQGYELGETNQYRRLKVISEVLGRPVEWFLHGDLEQTDPATIVAIRDELAAVRSQVERNTALLEALLAGREPDPVGPAPTSG
jgi:transcriptional regulator with XRE-family HTH domain